MTDTEQIWNAYQAGLRRFIQRRVTDASMVDDLLQEIFMKISSRIDTLKDNRRLQGWLYEIARNSLIDYYRRNKRMEEIPWEIHSTASEENKAIVELGECVRPMIEALPKPYREALLLSELEGLTQKEVAERAGISLSGAKSRVQRGRAQLKAMFLACCHLEFDRRGEIMDYDPKGKGCKPC